MCGKKQISEPRKHKKRPNGAGTVYRKPGNRARPWVAEKAHVTIGHYPTQKDALDAIEKLAGKDITERYNMTFADVYEAWKAEHFRELTGYGTEGYETAYKHMAALYNLKFRSLKTADYQREIDKRIDAKKSRSGTDKDRQLIGQMCKWAMREEIIVINYAQFVKLQKNETAEKVIFTDIEIKKISDAAKTDDAAKIIVMLLSTGMRIGELFQLPAIDCHDKYVVGGEKTEAGRNRVIPIRPEGKPYFKYFLGRAGDSLLIDGYSGNSNPANFRRRDYAQLLDRLGIAYKTPHATRHTYASRARAEGMPPEILQKILGHANYSTTAEIYVHSDIDELISAVDRGSNLAVTQDKQA